VAWGSGRALAAPTPPPVYIPRGEPRGPPSCPRQCPLRRAGTRPPHTCRGRSDACAATAAPWGPRGCPFTPPCSPGTHRPFWAALDRSGRGLPHPASREGARGLPDPLCRRRPWRNVHTPVHASLRDTLIGCHLWRSRWRISRSAPTRRDCSNLISGVCSISPKYLDIGPGSPPDWSVFTWRIELTCGSPFGRLLPSYVSVLFLYCLYFGGYSISMIARLIDPAPLPSDNESTMGPGFAVFVTPGSASDVARTKVLLPRLEGDSVHFIVRLRSVAIYRLFNQCH